MTSRDPISFDQELTRNLGLSAVEQMLIGRSNCLVTIQADKVACIPFDQMIDPATGRTEVRLVDVLGHPYEVALQLMDRLTSDGLAGPEADALGGANKPGIKPV